MFSNPIIDHFSVLTLPPVSCLPWQLQEKSPELKKWRPLQSLPRDPARSNAMRSGPGSLGSPGSHGSRPRCGVPDFPAPPDSAHRLRGPRRRRFVLYGGRLDKTHLTYRSDALPI
uniref:Uncharacterized protein n=1 Tax=Neogobius melanostomus TaxID=47308 RepID=A0A8C6WHT8_9GOBI